MSSASHDAPEFPAPIPSDHRPVHWVSRAAFPAGGAGLVGSQAGIISAVWRRGYWPAVFLVLIASHFMHGTLVGFHEASHSNLRKSRFLNDLDGLLIGTLSFMSFTLYRVAHQTHHSHLATERDEELWPFVKTDSPRWFRRFIAFVELNAGLIFTPFLFARMFLRKDSFIRNQRVRRRIWMEFALIVLANALIVASVTGGDGWASFVGSYVAPAVIAGNLQSWRKYIEHVGLSGHTARSATRCIITDNWAGRFISVTLLHEPFHGVHHIHAGLPHYEMPGCSGLLQPADDGDVPPFPNYRSAIMDLLRNLRDPRSGSHWTGPALRSAS